MASATQILVDVQRVEHWWVLKIAKGWVCLTHDELLAGLRRGKRLRRRQHFQARHREEAP
jgi:hypothetical protein